MANSIRMKNLITYLEKLAPEKLQASWDNSGLLVGLYDDNVGNILLSLDVTQRVVEYALSVKADLILSHHPYFMSPVKKINDPLLLKIIRNKISLYSMHTNLDFVEDGVNSQLAELLGLEKTVFLSHIPEIISYHITVYTPKDAVNKVADAMFAAGAGIIGNYSHCMNTSEVKGFFKPLPDSNPYIGDKELDEIVAVQEVKMELTANNANLNSILPAMINAHPYETPAYRVFPLYGNSPNHGLGMVGNLPHPMSLKDLTLMVKEKLNAPYVQLWLAGKPESELVTKVAVCGGSGGDLINTAKEKADVFVTADLKYHSLIGSSIPLIDAGHFFTESPVLQKLDDYLKPLNLNVEIFDKASADIHDLICL